MTKPSLAMGKAKRMKQPVVLSVNEVKIIFDLIRVSLAKMALALIYCCRLRLNEVVAIRADDVDRSRRLLLIRGSKGQIDRKIPLSELALWILDIPRTPSVWLFPSREGHISVRALQSAFRSALLQSGIPKKASISSLLLSSVAHALEKARERGLDKVMVLSELSKSTTIVRYIRQAENGKPVSSIPPEIV